jgi:hypothetical protein
MGAMLGTGNLIDSGGDPLWYGNHGPGCAHKADSSVPSKTDVVS